MICFKNKIIEPPYLNTLPLIVRTVDCYNFMNEIIKMLEYSMHSMLCA